MCALFLCTREGTGVPAGLLLPGAESGPSAPVFFRLEFVTIGWPAGQQRFAEGQRGRHSDEKSKLICGYNQSLMESAEYIAGVRKGRVGHNTMVPVNRRQRPPKKAGRRSSK